MTPLSLDPDSSFSEDSGAPEEEVLETRQAQVSLEQHGSRLDRALCAMVPEFSRSYLQQLLALGAVQVNQRVAEKAALKVKVGDQLRIEMRPTLQSQAFQPEDLPLEIVYEDVHLLVVNKAPGMVVHPAPGNWSGTLLNALLARDPGAAVVPRAGIVHRLDKDTSGLMVVARDRLTMDALVALIAARDVSRQYLALAHKPWLGAKTCTVNRAIGRDPRNRLKMAVVDLAVHAGKTAQTDFALLAGCAEGALVQCTLHTGRTHQIRVHMASIGHPLVADSVYGGHLAAGMQRQALHAFRLAFIHPMTGTPLEFHAPLPVDMQAACDFWRLGYNRPQVNPG